AVGAAIAVTAPHLSGVGGDGYIMLYDPQIAAEPIVINATGCAPLRATPEAYSDGIPLYGMRSVSVPGLVDGWLQAHERYGSLSLEACLAPAIDLAENGFPVTQKLAQALLEQPLLLTFPSSRAIFAPHGEPLRFGQILVQTDLARTLRAIARNGRDSFYEGEIARAILAASEAHGGFFGPDDLRECRAEVQDAIATTYRGHTVFESPPNSSGHALLQMLNLVENFDLGALGPNGAAAIHLMVEAKRLVFADREAFVADPRFSDIPLLGLLDKSYAAERARLIDPERAAPAALAGEPRSFEGRVRAAHTTCFAVVDGNGRAVCQIQSLQSFMGSALVVAGTGILLNNRMTYWHLEPGHVNRLEPGKRVRHTMNTVMVFREGKLFMVHGTPGADTQTQTNLQVLTHVVDHGMNVTEAVEAPRWRHIGRGTESTTPHGEDDTLNLEARFPEGVVAELARRGHPVASIGPWEAAGSEVMIRVDHANGALHGACDPRADGYAIGY
ncbi:MAG TPA: gamma-glutamyltransferase, partial [Candidatus Baltobacteraceae bacterium]|nr:gamma-glutamyltransferase [Candidatus Baltobacteraceae bacterium]